MEREAPFEREGLAVEQGARDLAPLTATERGATRGHGWTRLTDPSSHLLA